jgi:hypothetical protein
VGFDVDVDVDVDLLLFFASVVMLNGWTIMAWGCLVDVKDNAAAPSVPRTAQV